jgi:hypothetical protein
VKFLYVEENAMYDMCHTRNYIIISDDSLCREEPLKSVGIVGLYSR